VDELKGNHVYGCKSRFNRKKGLPLSARIGAMRSEVVGSP
jgi:hypothetical protein